MATVEETKAKLAELKSELETLKSCLEKGESCENVSAKINAKVEEIKSLLAQL